MAEVYVHHLRRRLGHLRRRLLQGRRSLTRQVKNALLSNRQSEWQIEALRPFDTPPNDVYRLSADELQRYAGDGYVMPLQLCSADQMHAVARYIRTFTLATDCPVPGFPRTKWRHIDDAVVFAIGSHPSILDRVAQLLGDDILLWQSNLFDKQPGDDEIAWHQDRAFLELAGGVNVSAWVAIDDVDADNGCVQVIPGSHQEVLPLADPAATQGSSKTAFGRMADLTGNDDRGTVDVTLMAGQFMLFDEYLAHRSGQNKSRRQRLGLALRYTTPAARVTHQLAGFHSLLVRGRDSIGNNRLGLPPARWPRARR